MPPFHFTLRDIFQRAGLRYTRQREIVYAELRSLSSHPTAEELLERIRARSRERAPLSLSTLYNTLDSLVACGLARRVSTAAGPARYLADTDPQVLGILPDGEVRDLPAQLVTRLLAVVSLQDLSASLGVPVESFDIHVMIYPRSGSVLPEKAPPPPANKPPPSVSN